MKKTKIVKKNCIDENLELAGQIIRDGGLVIFPTETVYGIGADAFNEDAVKTIFEAKGRPQDNPLIVHIYDVSQLDELVERVPKAAKKVIDKFWPGPLTILFNKKDTVPKSLTGGLNTVAVRMPDNETALKLLESAKRPIAAPSANISGKPSPTNVDHVVLDLYGKVDMIIDGGDTNVGIESTVLDMTTVKSVILRPGAVTISDLETVLDNVEYDPSIAKDPSKAPRSPGQKYRHYCPDAEMKVFVGDEEKVTEKMVSEEEKYIDRGYNVAILTVEEHKSLFKSENIIVLGKKEDYPEIAKNLFKALRECDSTKVDIILSEGFEEEGIGKAIMNRLEKASGKNIEYL